MMSSESTTQEAATASVAATSDLFMSKAKSQPIKFISNRKMTTTSDYSGSGSLADHYSAGSFGAHVYSSNNSKYGAAASNSTQSKVSRIFTEVREVQEGKVDNLLRVMSFHPEFLQEFISLYNYLMYSQHGALPYDSRHFIAIMAATRHKCIYLVKQQEREFLNQNGQRGWLKYGLACIPQKLKDLYELNKLLCHQPWLINHTHLEKILKGPYSWTVTELTMAITILTLFHSLAGFVFGCGINENYTQELRRQYEREAAAEEEIASRCRQQQQQQQQHQSVRNGGGKKRRSSKHRRVGEAAKNSTTVTMKSEDEHEHVYDDDVIEQQQQQPQQPNGDDEEEIDEDDDECEEEETNEMRFADEDDNNEHNDENLELCASTAYANAGAGSRSSRVVNFRNSSGSSCEMAGGQNVSRARSNSTGTSNRTLSNSSASSCELGIDMLLKEMQMIKAEDNTKQQQQSNKSAPIAAAVSAAATLTTSPVSTTPAMSSSFAMMQKIIRSTSPNSCTSSSSSGIYTHAQHTVIATSSSSGPNTITTNSPTTNGSGSGHSYYLSDLSNTAATTTINSPTNATTVASAVDAAAVASTAPGMRHHYMMQHQGAAIHDNNNNSIHHHHPHYHHHNNPHHPHYRGGNNNHHTTNGSTQKDMINDDDSKAAATTTTTEVNESPVTTTSQQQQQINQKIRDYMLKYAFDADYGYEELSSESDQSAALRLEYYTWENQGYITAASIYPDICEFLDKNFQVAANMTYNTMGNVKGVDTSLFRKAVWFYTHSLLGVKHDDYDYNQIRALLKSPLRKYIKLVCTAPERITKAHYDSIMREFTHAEKVHVNLVIMEARIQASMLYFLRAVNTYFGQ